MLPDRRPRDDARDAVDAFVRQQAAQAEIAARPAPHRRDARPYIIGALAAVFFYLWFGDPPILRIRSAAEPSAAEQEAGLRLALFLESQRIEEFRAGRGRLPKTLAECGGPAEGIEYVVLDGGRFRLSAAATPGPITLESGASPDAFLGGSLSVLGFDGPKP